MGNDFREARGESLINSRLPDPISQPLLVIIGPTAVGKTTLSLHLAARFKGEIISADSRLFYRKMDIGTAKPSLREQSRIPHHLIDICDADEIITLAEYQRRAYAEIESIQDRGHLPILVGGTGQYIKAVVEGWSIPEVPPQPELRFALERMGGPELARWLRSLDPESAEKIDPRNVRRIIRAIEVTLVKGKPISELQRKTPPPYRIKMIGLFLDRESLYQRIDGRVDQMMADGLLAEVESLQQAGYGRELPPMSGLGYRQLWSYLEGEMTFVEAVERIKFETHRFARQQATWFRHDDPRIKWFNASEHEMVMAITTYVDKWLNNIEA